MDMKKESKISKKAPSIMRIAAKDKENLTSKIYQEKSSVGSNNKEPNNIIARKLKKKVDSNCSELQSKKNKNNVKRNASKQTNSIKESDLTGDAPSENYWQKLAENYRTALDSALKENISLHNNINELNNKVNELEYENNRLKALHEEAKALVEVLTEMIEQNDDSS